MKRNPMKENSWILSSNLLFRPTIVQDEVLRTIKNQINYGRGPLLSIAYTIEGIMEAHTIKNLEPILESLKIAFKTTYNDLHMLRLGFKYIVDTIIITLRSKEVSESDRIPYAKNHFEKSKDCNVIKIQEEIIKDLRSTINLYKMDASGALVFQFLVDNTPFDNEYFLAGMEMAIVIFSGLTPIISTSHPDLIWPPPTQVFTIAT